MTMTLTALMLGVAGSTHCLLMCGPLVAATQPRAISGAVGLHSARILTYAVLGAFAGGAGSLVEASFWQRSVAGAAATLLVVQAVTLYRPTRTRHGLASWIGRQVMRVHAWLRRHQVAGPLVAGVVNGLLPCGLVYGALTGAAGLANPWSAAGLMAAFGVGTVPLLAGAARPATHATSAIAVRFRLAGPVMLLVLAALLASRAIGPSIHMNLEESSEQSAHHHGSGDSLLANPHR